MKKLASSFFTVAAALLASALSGCYDGEVIISESSGNNQGGPSISVAVTTPDVAGKLLGFDDNGTRGVSMVRNGVEIEVAVTSDSYWTVESSQPWVVPVPSKGSGNGTVKLSVDDNEGNSVRTADISFIVYQQSTGWKWNKSTLKLIQSATDEVYVEGPIEKLVKFIKNNHAGVSSSNGTATLGYTEDSIEAVVLAGYGDGNIGNILAVGDNTGFANSAILLYDTSFGSSSVSKFPQGAKVKISGLNNATYNNYYGLRELKGVTATPTGETVPLFVPTITAAQLNTDNYQGQYVQLEGVTVDADFEGKPWVTEAAQSVTCKDKEGTAFTLRMGKAQYAAAFADYTVSSTKVGTVRCLAESYSSKIQSCPVYTSDIEQVSNVSLKTSTSMVVVGNAAASTATFTVNAKEAWTATATGSGFTFSPASGDGKNNTVTVTTTAASTSDVSTVLGSIAITSGANKAAVSVRQKGTGAATSIMGLYDYIQISGLSNGGSLSGYGSQITAYVAANNESGNLFGTLVIIDNTGKAYSGMIFYDSATTYNEANMPVGSEVKIDLSKASYVPYNNLPEITGAAITATGKKVTINVPKLTGAQANTAAYVGQYICIEQASTTAGGVWNSGTSNYVNTNFKAADNTAIAVRVSKDAVFAKSRYIAATGALYGVMEVYSSSYQIFPTSTADIAPFAEPTDPTVNVTPDALTFKAAGEALTLSLQVLNFAADYSVTATPANATQFTAAVSTDKATVTVTAAQNTASTAVESTLTITVKDSKATVTKTIDLKQYAAVSADATQLTYTLADIAAAQTGGSLSGAYQGTVSDPTTWVKWTKNSIPFVAAGICTPNSTSNYPNTIQIQGSSSDTTKQGFMANAESLVDVQSVKFVILAPSSAKRSISVYMGGKAVSETDYSDDTATAVTDTNYAYEQISTTPNIYRQTITYEFAGSTEKYKYFKLANKSGSTIYVESVTISYKK